MTIRPFAYSLDGGDMLWIFVGIVVWALGILFVLVLLEMAAQQQERAARHEGETFAEESVTQAVINTWTRSETVVESPASSEQLQKVA